MQTEVMMTWWQWACCYGLALVFLVYINYGVGQKNKEWDRMMIDYHNKMVDRGYRKGPKLPYM